MYTEAEAKEKWCCTVFVNIFHVEPENGRTNLTAGEHDR